MSQDQMEKYHSQKTILNWKASQVLIKASIFFLKSAQIPAQNYCTYHFSTMGLIEYRKVKELHAYLLHTCACQYAVATASQFEPFVWENIGNTQQPGTGRQVPQIHAHNILGKPIMKQKGKKM